MAIAHRALAIPSCIADVKKLAEAHTSLTQQPTNIAVAVVIIKDGRVLLGKRRSSGTWGFPGGTLESTDTSLEHCGARETLEEAGIKVKNIRLVDMVPAFIEERQTFYFTMIAVADWDIGEAYVKEPLKAEEWKWFEWADLPDPLFPPNRQLIESGFNPFR